MKKLKWSNILMIICIVLIFAYIFVQVYSVTHIELETETAVLTTIYDKIDAKALVIRDEHAIPSPSDGVTVPAVNDGDKVKAGGNVAMKFSSSEAATGYSKYAELQAQIKYYERLQTQTLGRTASIDSLNSEIESEINTYVRAIDKNKADAVDSAGKSINDSLLRRQMIIGEEVDLMSIIQELSKQAEQYASSSTPNGFVSTDISGVFSSYTDGYEKVLDYEKAEEATIEQIENALEKVSKADDSDEASLGKLVTSYVWYLECVLDSAEVKNLKDGQKVEIALKNSDDTVLYGEIISGAEPEPKEEKTALIIKCSEMSQKLASLRSEEIEIRIKSYEGFKVPASALHVNGERKGVYALISSQIHFREAEVIYSADDYVLLKFDPDNSNGIRLYDQIITQGKELEDGKVYT